MAEIIPGAGDQAGESTGGGPSRGEPARDSVGPGRYPALAVAAGRPYTGTYEIPRSYEQAREALLLAGVIGDDLDVVHHRHVLSITGTS